VQIRQRPQLRQHLFSTALLQQEIQQPLARLLAHIQLGQPVPEPAGAVLLRRVQVLDELAVEVSQQVVNLLELTRLDATVGEYSVDYASMIDDELELVAGVEQLREAC